MFVLEETGTYWWPVKVWLPQDGGRYECNEFEACIARLNTDELKVASGQSPIDIVRSALRGWRGVKDSDGQDVPFNDRTKEAMLRIPQAIFAIPVSILDSQIKAREKN